MRLRFAQYHEPPGLESAQVPVAEGTPIEQRLHPVDHRLFHLAEEPGLDRCAAPVVELARSLRRQHHAKAGPAGSLEQPLQRRPGRPLAGPGGQEQVGAVDGELAAAFDDAALGAHAAQN